MAKVRKQRRKIKNDPDKIYGIIDPSISSFDNDPYFIKKAQKAKELLEKCPIPKAFFEDR